LKPVVLFVLTLVACHARAQSYDFTLTNPDSCGIGCKVITGSGEFTVTGTAIDAWSGTINGQPLNLLSGLFNTPAMPSSASSPWELSSPFFPYAVNLVPLLGCSVCFGKLGCSGCMELDKAPPTPGSTLIWYAPVFFKVTPVPLAPAPKQSSMAARNLGLGVGVPVAVALTVWLVRHELRAHRHREAIPAGEVHLP
jgi:hypothetical protein